MNAPPPGPLAVVDLGRMPFADAWRLQEERAALRAEGRAPDALFLVEHDPVYTLGRNADERHVLPAATGVDGPPIAVVRTTRGGQVTYHGPGQLVAYPILDLGARGQGASWYVRQLEETAIRTLAAFGVTGGRDPQHRGVWIGNDKIAAVGVRIARRVTMHGLSLNVRVALDDYRGIVPCGIRGKGVTSLHQSCQDVQLADVKPVFVREFRSVFGYDN